jgi:hypothetical protein
MKREIREGGMRERWSGGGREWRKGMEEGTNGRGERDGSERK